MAMIAARQAEESRLHGHDHSHDTPRQREIEERRREEEMAKVMVGMEGGLFSWRRAWIWIKGALGFIGGLVGLTVITVSGNKPDLSVLVLFFFCLVVGVD